MENGAMDAAANAAIAGAGALYSVLCLVFYVLVVVAWWKIFEKAGEDGWKAIIPFYNTYIIFKIAWGNGWLFLLLLVPCVNFVVLLILNWKLINAFGKGVGFFILSIFFPYIAYLILGFGSDDYIGPQ